MDFWKLEGRKTSHHKKEDRAAPVQEKLYCVVLSLSNATKQCCTTIGAEVAVTRATIVSLCLGF